MRWIDFLRQALRGSPIERTLHLLRIWLSTTGPPEVLSRRHVFLDIVGSEKISLSVTVSEPSFFCISAGVHVHHKAIENTGLHRRSGVMCEASLGNLRTAVLKYFTVV